MKCEKCGTEILEGGTCSVCEAERASAEERDRVKTILDIGREHNQVEIAQKAIQEGWTSDRFMRSVLESIGAEKIDTPDATIGMEGKEVQKYSYLKILRALAFPHERRYQEEARFERECSDAVAKRMHKTPQGFFLPADVQKRDLNVTTGSAGGYTVSTDLLAASFIELLRNRMMTQKMGAKVLDGLVGDVAIPSQTGGATAYWVAESGAPTESQQTIGQVALTPKTCGAFTDISRKLILQSSIAIENFVAVDLATVLALAIDLAALHGSGSSNQPTGIASTSGIGSVAGGTNGAAPDYADIVNLWKEVSIDNADLGALGYLTNSKVIGKLMQTAKVSSTDSVMICNKLPDRDGFTELIGMRCGVSNQVASNLDKGTSTGVCSAIFFGNWADLIIGQWGTTDITTDPYTGSTSGTVRIVALQDVDIAVRHAVSFAAMLDALTT